MEVEVIPVILKEEVISEYRHKNHNDRKTDYIQNSFRLKGNEKPFLSFTRISTLNFFDPFFLLKRLNFFKQISVPSGFLTVKYTFQNSSLWK